MSNCCCRILSLEWCTLTDEAEYVPIGDLPTVPNLLGVIFLSLENSDISYVCRTFELVKTLPAEQLVENYVIKGILSESSLTQRCRKLVSYTLKCSTAFSQTWKKKQGGTKFIPSRSALQLGRPGPLKAPTELFDPTNPSFDGFFFTDEHPFPDLQALGFNDEVLRDWGLQVHLTPSVAMSRAKLFASCGKNMEDLMKKVSQLLRTNLKEKDLSDSIFIEELRSLKWLPAMHDGQIALCSPKQCRPKPDQTVVGHVFGIVDVNVDHIWSQALGWDRTIEAQVLIKQLEACVPKKDLDSIKDTLEYLERNCRSEDYVSSVQNIQCLQGATSDLFLPRGIFLSQQKNLSRLAPYVDAIHPRLARSAIPTRLRVKPEPTLEHLLKIQHQLAGRGPKLNSADLDVSIAIMDLASVYPRDELTELMGPDENCSLVPISKLTVKDHSRSAALKNLGDLMFCHPKIQSDILSKLEIDTLRARLLKSEIELEDEDEDEFTPREDLLTSISDTLSRYAPSATFNEYLANAEDSGASKVEWLLDDCSHHQHPDTELLDTNLRDFQGPALFVYNDGIFSDEDFKGLKRIGRGSKFDKELAIGMHGRGSLTMYHFTDVPMILSASSLLVLDPHERNLPRNSYNKRKTGVKCEISTARKMFPHQLAPFEGLFGYSSDVKYFQGTIFRFPLRMKNARSSLVQKQSYIKVQDTINLLTLYLEEAKSSMIFLRSVKEVSFKLRHEELHEWRVITRIYETESTHTRRVQVATFDPKNRRADPISETNWWVGRYANTPRPQLKPPRKMLNKKFECGVAACMSTDQQRVQHKVYCTLPTSILSSLPISYHGSFAITGDRQTIPVGDDQKDIMPRWNKWILEDCVADLYANFLAEICDETGLDVYHLWPNAVSDTDDTSRIVRNKFWENLREHEYDDLALFPVVGQHGTDRQIVSLTEARFDFLPRERSEALQPLLSQICSNVVRPPPLLKRYFKPMLEANNICSLTPDYLQEQFRKDSSCAVLEEFLKGTPHEDRAYIWAHMADSMIVPTAVKDASLADTQRFDGCRILPLRSGKLETIVVRTDKSITPIYFVGTVQENALFYFAKDRFVDHDYVLREDSKPHLLWDNLKSHLLWDNSKPHLLWDIVRSELFNVRSLKLTDVGTLLLDSGSPLNGSQAALGKWLEHFWKYFNSHLEARLRKQSADKADVHKLEEETLSSCGLVDLKICRSFRQNEPIFISVRELDSGPYLVAPLETSEIELCEKLPGVILLHPDYIPAPLRIQESSLSNPRAFDRFVQVLKRLAERYNGGVGKFLQDNLQKTKLDVRPPPVLVLNGTYIV
jgi:sacsin